MTDYKKRCKAITDLPVAPAAVVEADDGEDDDEDEN